MDNPPCVFLSPPFTPHRAHRARGCSGDMQLDCKATAARRQASRLADLVCFPVWRPIQTAIRRWASWLAPPHPLDAGFPKSPPQGGKTDRHLLRRKQNPCKGCVCPTPTAGNHKPSFVEAAKQSSCRNHVTPQGVSLPTADSGKQKPRKGCVCPTPTMGKQKPSFVEAAKQSICRNHVTPQGVRMPHANCGGAERR